MPSGRVGDGDRHPRGHARAAIVELEDEPVETLLPTPTQRLARREDDKLLLAALRAIPLHSQIVLELSHFEELGRFEIAEVLGVPPGTIASRLRRGRKQLEGQLERLAHSPSQLVTTRRGLAGWIESIQRAVGDDG